tara:strand:+ start:616 stop:948 length:333 start_codon:yes stop_codon:yes gene_type:complete
MNLNELREMVKEALKEHAEQEWQPFEQPEEEEESTNLSFAEDDEADRPDESARSLADVRKEIHDLMDAAMETLKNPTEKHQKKYAEFMGQLQVLNQELENLSNTKEKQEQ